MAKDLERVVLPSVLTQAVYQETIHHCLKAGLKEDEDIAKELARRAQIAFQMIRALEHRWSLAIGGHELTVDDEGQLVVVKRGD